MIASVQGILLLWSCRSPEIVCSPVMVQQPLKKGETSIFRWWVQIGGVIEERYIHIGIAHGELASLGELGNINLNYYSSWPSFHL